MGKKKVTLSVDSKVYEDFQKYCEERAILVSKKIELFMKEFMKSKRRLLVFAFVFAALFISYAQAGLIVDKNSSDFAQGTFYRTIFNSSGFVQLNTSAGLFGDYYSRIFDGTSGRWNNISWVQGGPYGVGLPDNQNVESSWMSGNANMSGNVLLLHFNETSANSAPGGTDALDSSGLGNNANESGGVTFGAVGITGSAFLFDGIDDSVEVPAQSVISPLNAMTMEAWIYWRGGNQEGNLENIITNGHPFRALRLTEPGHWYGGNKLLADVRFRNGACGSSGDTQLYSNDDLAVNTWNHVAMTYNGSVFAIYVNGQLDNSMNRTGLICSPSINTFIGTEQADYFFNGSIDEVAIYNRSLSSNEIRDHFVRGVTRLNLSVRSCDDPNCADEVFTSLNSSSPQQLNLSDNRYFQYKFGFQTKNESANLQLYNVSIDYTLINTPPRVFINLPANNSLFGYNNSIALNFSIQDSEGNQQACWYSVNGGANVSIINCENTTLNVNEGLHTLRLYANDSYGGLGSNSTTFGVDLTKPYLFVTNPLNQSYSSVKTFLNYTVNDVHLQSCWYSTNNGQINFSITCGQNVTGLSSVEGSNTWSVWANDSLGNVNVSAVNFFVDSVAPVVSFMAPTLLNASYTQNVSIIVNVSLTELNLDSALIQLDSTNYTFSCVGETNRVCNRSFSNIGEGVHKIVAFANDSVGNMNATSRTFTVDLTPPNIVIHSPQNTIYNSSNFLINYSASDSNGVQACWYNLDSFWTNQTLFGCSTTSISVSDGNHSLLIYANDSAGNWNYSRVDFYADATPPQWSSIQQSVPSKYSPSVLSYFNVSWSDAGTIQNVLFESNFSGSPVNYSMYLISGNVYGFNVSLPAGAFYWRSYAIDSLGNLNATNMQAINVTKAANPIVLYFNGNGNGNLSVNYGTQTNVSVASALGSPTLTRDSILVSNPEIAILGAKPSGYFYTGSVAENQNYSGNSSSYYLFVQRLTSEVHLALNSVESNQTVSYGSAVNASTWSANGTPLLYRNGNYVGTNEIVILGVGLYNYTAIIPDSENISGSSAAWFLNVTKASPNIQLLLQGVPADNEIAYGIKSNVSASENNAGDSDLIYTLYRNGQFVSNGSLIVDNEIYAAGLYNYTFNTSGGMNYTSGQISRMLNITRSAPILNLTLSGIDGNITQVYGNSSHIVLNANVPVSLFLYRDNEEVAYGFSPLSVDSLLGVGLYNYTGYFEGNENYTSVYVSRFLNISKATPEMVLLLNGMDSDLSVPVGSVLHVNGNLYSPADESVSLYENSDLIDSGVSEVNAELTYGSIGNRIWTLVYEGNQNYSARNISHTVVVNDPSWPQYSNLSASPSSPTQYLPSKQYRFNATWTDNVGIDDVVFVFNGSNYSYAGGQVQKNGKEYFIVLGDLAAGSYSYRWYANDTSGNLVASSVYEYSILKGSASLIIQVSPSENVIYGTTTYATCYASNSESEPELIRDTTPILELPDTGVFAAGSYTYFCTAAETRNYSGATAIPKVLIVAKTTPGIELLLNNISDDIVLPSTGGNVSISAALSSPPSGSMSVSIDGLLFADGESPLLNESFFGVIGNHTVLAWFDGNQNYTFGSVSRIVTVKAHSGDSGSGSGGSGGGGGGGGSSIIKNQSNVKPEKKYSLTVESIADIAVKRGTQAKVILQGVNNGASFLNNCKVVIRGENVVRFASSEVKGISAGEKFSFDIVFDVPHEIEPKEYIFETFVSCDEAAASTKFNFYPYRDSFGVMINSYERDGNSLRVLYTVQEFAHVDRGLQIEYALVDFDNIPHFSGKTTIPLKAGQTYPGILNFQLPKDSFGEFDFRMRLSDGISVVDTNKTIFLPTQRGLTGLPIEGESGRKLSIFGMILVGLILMFLIGKFIYKFHMRTHYEPREQKTFIALDVNNGTSSDGEGLTTPTESFK